ncbi:hypothetical protein [Kribbella antibiotica]|nr:hypothetical protein [Kribbella antibiotica]
MSEVTRRLVALLRLVETDRTQPTVADDDVLLDTTFGRTSAEFPMDRY